MWPGKFRIQKNPTPNPYEFLKEFSPFGLICFSKENVMRVLANDMEQQRSQNCPKVSVRGLPSVFLLISSKLILAKEGICEKCDVV